MSQVHNRIKSIKRRGIRRREKPCQSAQRASGKDRNRTSHSQQEYDRRKDNSRQPDDFVSRVYKDTGFICEI